MDRIDLNHEIPVIILDNFYDECELDLVWKELDFFTHSHKLRPPDQTGSAREVGKIIKNNLGLWLDAVWAFDRNLSNILTANRKIFSNDMEIFRKSPSWFFKTLQVTRDSTLLSYYENKHYYAEHHDESMVTSLSWFYREPKAFKGGNLKLNLLDKIEEIEIRNNRTVIFPGNLKHEVEPISMEPQYENQKLGRYCISQFLNHR